MSPQATRSEIERDNYSLGRLASLPHFDLMHARNRLTNTHNTHIATHAKKPHTCRASTHRNDHVARWAGHVANVRVQWRCRQLNGGPKSNAAPLGSASNAAPATSATPSVAATPTQSQTVVKAAVASDAVRRGGAVAVARLAALAQVVTASSRGVVVGDEAPVVLQLLEQQRLQAGRGFNPKTAPSSGGHAHRIRAARLVSTLRRSTRRRGRIGGELGGSRGHSRSKVDARSLLPCQSVSQIGKTDSVRNVSYWICALIEECRHETEEQLVSERALWMKGQNFVTVVRRRNPEIEFGSSPTASQPPQHIYPPPDDLKWTAPAALRRAHPYLERRRAHSAQRPVHPSDWDDTTNDLSVHRLDAAELVCLRYETVRMHWAVETLRLILTIGPRC